MLFFDKLGVVFRMIKFEHSVFALPFALTGALLALRESGLDIWRAGGKLAWIILAMVAARSAAMAFNRLVDAELDARNPRTRTRAIPAGEISRAFAWGFVVFWSGALLAAAAMLNPLCLKLAPAALAVVFGYSFTKRFTSLSHLVLGLALGLAPAAAWIAIRGTLDAEILLLTAAVMFWTAGFDIVYSCQDREFDAAEGLYSLPRALGAARALWAARAFHLIMIGLLCILAMVLELGWLSLAGVAVIAVLLIYEHSLVSPDDFSRVDAAFFTVNGFVGVLFFLFWAADVVLAP